MVHRKIVGSPGSDSKNRPPNPQLSGKKPSTDTCRDLMRRTTLVGSHLPEAPPPSPFTIVQFLQALAQSELFSAEEIESLKAELPDDGMMADAGEFAQRLVDRQVLTEYQSEILLGNSKTLLRYGDYEVLDKLGQGGMGTVYLARHRQRGHTVALKVVKASDERFVQEVRAVSKLSHDNIVAVYEHGKTTDVEFLAMEYVDGPTLDKHVEEHGTLTVETAVDYLLQAARGVACIHQQRIVHRDLKPQNLLVGSAGVVKVMDLGLARFDLLPSSFSDGLTAEQRLTVEGTILGTPAYMAPEQIQDSRSADHRSDIYSLGCTFYFLLAGRPPFYHFNPMKTVTAHLNDPIPVLGLIHADVSPALESIFVRMMAKKVDDRYPTIQDLIDDLERFQRGEKVAAAPPASRSKVATTPPSGVGAAPATSRSRGRTDLLILVGAVLFGALAGLAGWWFK